MTSAAARLPTPGIPLFGSTFSTMRPPHNRLELFQLPPQTPRKPLSLPRLRVYSTTLPHTAVRCVTNDVSLRADGVEALAIGPDALFALAVGAGSEVSVDLPINF